jgi:hypothetical protein
MNGLLGTMALAAMVAMPPMALAQDRDGWRSRAYAYSYADADGRYEPFAYRYSDADDAYYSAHGARRGGYGYDRHEPAPADVGWSAGAPPADCGRWVWREGRGAYEWVPRPC